MCDKLLVAHLCGKSCQTSAAVGQKHKLGTFASKSTELTDADAHMGMMRDRGLGNV
jgi:hypothetical protein